MIHAILYNNSSSPETLKKRLDEIASKDISQYDVLDIEEPTLLLSGQDIDDLKDCNYLYIEELERFYYCVPTLLSDGMYQLTCSVDPLMSFSDDILLLEAVVDKQQYDNNMYYDDGSFITESRENIQVVNFSDGFNDSGRYILIACGG